MGFLKNRDFGDSFSVQISAIVRPPGGGSEVEIDRQQVRADFALATQHVSVTASHMSCVGMGWPRYWADLHINPDWPPLFHHHCDAAPRLVLLFSILSS